MAPPPAPERVIYARLTTLGSLKLSLGSRQCPRSYGKQKAARLAAQVRERILPIVLIKYRAGLSYPFIHLVQVEVILALQSGTKHEIQGNATQLRDHPTYSGKEYQNQQP